MPNVRGPFLALSLFIVGTASQFVRAEDKPAQPPQTHRSLPC